MLNTLKKQYSYRKQADKEIIKIKALCTIIRMTPSLAVKDCAGKLLQQLVYKSSGHRIRNVCFITGRPRGNYRKLQMSRMIMRELINAGYFVGFKKTS